MTFLNPWGLLALLAIPVILGLHFFRQQRQHRRIGGLHLWDFARIATPAGRRLERLYGSLPLLFQILAAILLALLLARLDIPTKQAAQTYTIVLDDSVSMQATVGGKSAAQRAADDLTRWAPSDGKYTLVLAGPRAQVAVGPAGTRGELVRFLSTWKPSSDLADVNQAMNIAQKFSAGDSKLILLSDGAGPAASNAAAAVPWTVGRAAENRAIVFADRFRPSADQERIVASVQRFGGTPGSATLSVISGKDQVMSQQVDLATTSPVTVQLNFPPTDAPLRLQISPGGALAADDDALLLPGVVRPLQVFIDPALPNAPSFEKAVLAVPQVSLAASAAAAEVLFANAGSTVTAGAPLLRKYQFSAPTQTSESLRVIEGRDLMISGESPLTDGLVMEGVLWPFSRETPPDLRQAVRADIAFTSVPLLYREAVTSGAEVYRVNLALGASNITRHTAWPVLVMNILEEARAAMPGIARTNLRSGEELRLNLASPAAAGPENTTTLWRAGQKEPVQTWQSPPSALSGLQSGQYTIRQGSAPTGTVLAAFNVNLFNTDESNLQSANSQQPDADALTADTAPKMQQNFLVYYALLVGLLACATLAWVYQDAGH